MSGFDGGSARSPHGSWVVQAGGPTGRPLAHVQLVSMSRACALSKAGSWLQRYLIRPASTTHFGREGLRALLAFQPDEQIADQAVVVGWRFRVRMRSSAWRAVSASGSVCRYRSVVRRLPCPSRSFTIWMSVPPASGHEAWACRRS